jgi:hypothetical protein
MISGDRSARVTWLRPERLDPGKYSSHRCRSPRRKWLATNAVNQQFGEGPYQHGAVAEIGLMRLRSSANSDGPRFVMPETSR